MRLIDADAMKEMISAVIKKQNGKDNDLVPIKELNIFIDEQPTAYDIDNVVEELRQRSKEYNSGVRLHGKPEDMLTYEAIEIVKQGGVSDDVCEWRIFDNSLTDEPQWVYETTCGKYIGEEHASKAFVYCPYCGKKIKVVE